jgi:phosphoribosylformimino-5-aminoimidazole carboxamide ribotide isomerase
MLIPSIDLMGGRIVQLERGEKLKLASDDFEYWIDRFSAYSIVQLIDLDAAMGKGENNAIVERISQRLPVQVGGGIRTLARARQVLEAGAKRLIVGSSLFRATPQPTLVNTDFAAELATALGADAILAGIDTKAGHVTVKGWREQVELTPDAAIAELEPYCGGYLYTHVDVEGTLQGFPIAVAERLHKLTRRKLIVAGGIRAQQEIDALHVMGIDAVAGMAVYTGILKA